MSNITSSNAIIIYRDDKLVQAGMKLEKFSTDQSLTTDEVVIAEARMGVDGQIAVGYTPNLKNVTIMFEADSPSWRLINQSINIAKQAKTPVQCELVITIPALGKIYNCNKGAILSFTDVNLKKMLDPVTLKMAFEDVVSSI